MRLFGLVSGPSLETVARFAQARHVVAGETVITEGDVGELALLHDSPRTASVSAITDADLLCIDRETFLVAVGGQGVGVTPEFEVPPPGR